MHVHWFWFLFYQTSYFSLCSHVYFIDLSWWGTRVWNLCKYTLSKLDLHDFEYYNVFVKSRYNIQTCFLHLQHNQTHNPVMIIVSRITLSLVDVCKWTKGNNYLKLVSDTKNCLKLLFRQWQSCLRLNPAQIGETYPVFTAHFVEIVKVVAI